MKDDQASSTAFTVLQGILYVANSPNLKEVVPKDMQEACFKILSASEEGRKRLQVLDCSWKRKLIQLAEKFVMPGITLHYVMRKRFIEDYTHQCLKDGVTQVINFGAGFDTLAYRLSSQYPDTNFIELDHPATHKVKLEALISQEDKHDNLHLIPVDFAKRKLRDIVKESPCFDFERPTQCIIEGVLMYLNESQVSDFLRSLNLVSRSSIKLVFTAAQPSNKCKSANGIGLRLYLMAKREPLNWTLEKDKIGEFLTKNGYQLRDVAGAEEFKKLYLDENYRGVLNDGEYAIVAECSEEVQ